MVHMIFNISCPSSILLIILCNLAQLDDEGPQRRDVGAVDVGLLLGHLRRLGLGLLHLRGLCQLVGVEGPQLLLLRREGVTEPGLHSLPPILDPGGPGVSLQLGIRTILKREVSR